ncbi:hypothetical protein LCGC14_1551890 [marine sediment metagenome]|uniref:Uncharacterized protein n=1 Tax=marine sediment metagenome TaxID=412755 RepID=A0A0F9L635_9ZZZZ
MKTDDQILERIAYVEKKVDPIGFATSDLIFRLGYKAGKQFLKSDVTEKEYNTKLKWSKNKNDIIKEMKEYLSFAFQKATDERGISANRSLLHYQNWFWLIGDQDFADSIFKDFSNYGLEKLKEIEKKLKTMKEKDNES